MGIDPGFSGGLALIHGNDVKAVAMPIFTIKDGRRTRCDIDATQLAAIVKDWAPDHCLLEQVNAMPGQGVTSMFRFGEGLGVIRGVLATLHIPVTRVTPAVWKKHLGLSNDKERSRQRATELYPAYAHNWARKKDDGIAEALLLAHYGIKTGAV